MTIGSRTLQATPRLQRQEAGYVLLALMLVVALMVIAAAAAAPTISFEIRRDREQEMIHRGVQYSRAIRSYYKKFGRYPTRLEDLDNTNNLRYLRKHYRDPLNKNRDFKLLHYGDPGVSLNGGLGSIGGGSIPGANTVGAMNAAGSSGSTFGGSAFGGSSSSSFSQSSSFGGSSNSSFGGSSGGFGGSSNSSFASGFGNSASAGNTGSSSSGSGNQPGSTDSSQTGTSTSQDASSTPNSTGGSSSNQQTFGGGPIVGVASVCKETTIREFNKKKKYNEWQFVYDPTTDRGGLLTTPYQPMQAFASQPGIGQPANSNSSSFSQPTGFGNNNSGFSSPGFSNQGPMGAPAQPPSTTPQPQ